MAIFSSLAKSLLILLLNLSFLLLLLIYTPILLNSSPPHPPLLQTQSNHATRDCDFLRGHHSNEEKCTYLLSRRKECVADEGYIQYLNLFYCSFGKNPIFGYITLSLSLLLLFYLLANTAADYFCSNLEALSRLLNLHPTVAGVTLLSLGNGAPDVFSSIVSFTGTHSEVGLNSILGGVFFVSSVVVGIVSIVVGPRKITIDKSCFVRDVCFLLLVLFVLLAILVAGKIDVWGAMAFASLYLVYVFVVSMTHLYGKVDFDVELCDPFLDNIHKCTTTTTKIHDIRDDQRLNAPDRDDPVTITCTDVELCDPFLDNIDKCTTTTTIKIHDIRNGQRLNVTDRDDPVVTITHKDDEGKQMRRRILYFLELPLYLPRRVTIPDVSERRWSKPFAVVSVTLAPILLGALWVSKNEENRLTIYVFVVITGIVFGICAFVGTKKESPPRRILFPWLAGGFLMSVTWTYIIAQELVSLLVSLGIILDLSPSILGLTVLAWGNSLGDLIANVAVAVSGGPLGAQVAVSGCYGGPIFSTLVGLGMSLVLSSWARYPAAMTIPEDPTLFLTLGFLIAGLMWTLVMLPRRGMIPDRVLGVGLISIYLCFLCVRLGQSLGLIQMLL